MTADSFTTQHKGESAHPGWQHLYFIGGVVSLMTVVIALTEIGITFLPGGMADAVTAGDWFSLFQSQPLMALRNLGLVNMGFNALAIPLYLALCAAHRRTAPVPAVLAMLLAWLGVAVFFSTNRAFPMLELSLRYAVATSEAQRAALLAAGEAMLAVGASHTPGTFLAFAFSEIAGILVSVVMLRGKSFGKLNAYAGILGFALLLAYEVLASFAGASGEAAMLLAMVGGLMNMAWNILLALRLFELARA